MTRLKQAWLALCGKLEPEVREVVREVEKVTERLVPVGSVAEVFVVTSKAHKDAVKAYWDDRSRWHREKIEREYPSLYGGLAKGPLRPEPEEPKAPEWEGTVYMSCAQAFAERGNDAYLEMHKAIVCGDTALVLANWMERKVNPKPKIAKGKRK